MSSPPRKRLKQMNITQFTESFSKQNSKQQRTSEILGGDSEGDMDKSESDAKREQCKLAAERRNENATGEVAPDNESTNAEESKLKSDDAASGLSCKYSGTQKHLTHSPNEDNGQDTNIGQTDTVEYNDSSDLFDNDFESTTTENCASSGSWCAGQEESPSKGVKKTELKTQPDCSGPLPPLYPDTSLTVTFNYKSLGNVPPSPYPHTYHDRWNADYVRMPCSHENQYPMSSKDIVRRWGVIKQVLSHKMITVRDLEAAILEYNNRYKNKWDFICLRRYLNEELQIEERQQFFRSLLPKMVDLALDLPKICTQPIPLLKRRSAHTIVMSQKQAACLLANAFFCTFPRRNTRQKHSEYSNFPDINFNSLFQDSRDYIRNERKIEKLKCIFHYFKRVTSKMPTGTVSFKRQRLGRFPEWSTSENKLTRLHVTAHGTIEDDGCGMLQVDFANKYIGGGVLNSGLVQEEIRFMICPEMIVSRLFTEVLEEDECLVMTGCERFSNYTGYGDSFLWDGDHQDPTQRDDWKRLVTEVVAIDAVVYKNNYNSQFREHAVVRDINKAYCGFCSPCVDPSFLSAVATGNWGCGAFGGDHRLKALIQLMAASEAKRDVCYFTFENRKLRDEIHSVHNFIREKDLRISQLWKFIQEYNDKHCCSPSRKADKNIFEFIFSKYAELMSEDDDDYGASSLRKEETMDFNEPDYSADTP